MKYKIMYFNLKDSMMDDLFVQEGVTIPVHELDISASRSGGPGGQHVNKTSSRITVRWNIQTTTALTDAQKERVLLKLQSEVTTDGDLLVHSSASRSQFQNKQLACQELAQKLRKALHVPKKRVKTKVSKSAQEKRLEQKSKHSAIKKMRRVKHDDF